MKNILDAAKRFELQTKQEIKNYNSSREEMLREIQGLKCKIQEVDESHLEKQNAILNQMNEKILVLEKCVNFLSESVLEIQRKQRDQEELNCLMNSNFLVHQHEIELHSEKLSLWENIFELTNVTLNALYEEFKGNACNFSQSLDRFECAMREEIKSSKNELLNLPSESDQVRKELRVLIAANAVDVSGIMRELLIYKKDNMITQKKIEHLYTLIDRIKTNTGE